MSRGIRSAALVAVISLAGMVPAHTDFHPACTPAVAAVAGVGLSASGITFTFSGGVTCPGAASLSVDTLTLTPTIPPGSPTSAPPVSCGPCGSISNSGTALATPGIHEVFMAFTAIGNGFVFHPSRLGRFLWLGVGEPIRIG